MNTADSTTSEMRVRKIQPSQIEGSVDEIDGTKLIPYPYFISEDGMIGRQDFWRGTPERLVGFAYYDNPYEAVFTTAEWFEGEPESAVGLCPIFSCSNDDWFTGLYPIVEVKEETSC